MNFFVDVVRNYRLPQQVHEDQCVGNYGYAEYVINERDCKGESFIAGRSIHNQKTERLKGICT